MQRGDAKHALRNLLKPAFPEGAYAGRGPQRLIHAAGGTREAGRGCLGEDAVPQGLERLYPGSPVAFRREAQRRVLTQQGDAECPDGPL